MTICFFYVKIEEDIIKAYFLRFFGEQNEQDCQTDTDFLVHVIDDCSTEDLSPIIDMHKNLNIRVTRNEKNLGCGMTRQVGIDSTTADYIAFLDSDDVLMPYTVELWKCAVKANPFIDLFHSYFFLLFLCAH